MPAAPLPPNEAERLEKLRSLNLLDTSSEERYDRYVKLAKRLFDVPIALVSLIDDDRQWFKARAGLAATQTPREQAFCAHAILGNEALVVPDARLDARFADNPLVTGELGIRFYAGFPIEADGMKMGTLCLIDQQPRKLDPDQLQLLQNIGRLVSGELTAEEPQHFDRETGLTNRDGFAALTTYASEVCTRLKRPLSVVSISLIEASPEQVVVFARKLARTFDSADLIGRLSNLSFCILMMGADADEAHQHTQALLAKMEEPGNLRLGVAEHEAQEDVLKTMFRAAATMLDARLPTISQSTHCPKPN
ncbi:MAG: GAF domain-containing protein [Myxococcota bacterium]